MKLQFCLAIFCGILPVLTYAATPEKAARGDKTAAPAKEVFPKDVVKLDETNAEYFVARTLERSRALETAAVLQRLLMEKQKAGEASAKHLKDTYGILPAGNYVWEADDRTIYELTGEKTWRGEPKRMKFRKFDSEEEAKPAVQAMAKRLLLNQQAIVLSGLVAEQVDAATAADRALRTKFKLAEEGNYTFDVPRRTIVQTGIRETGVKKETK